ncbi:MAG: M20/M25/M40 family metallo-hydrolase [Pseudomonadota bacterium]
MSILLALLLNVLVRPALAGDAATHGELVSQLSFADYKNDITTLAGFGDREQGTESYDRAEQWIERRLRAAGYQIEYHEFSYWLVKKRRTLYVTKVGRSSPDEMYIVSAHLDGRGGGGAADDDASGVAVVLQAALVLAPDSVQTEKSVRFIFWNNEETGADGSRAYMLERSRVQGIENPAGSGRYPEPRWLGVIQHDMVLFDHGLPPQPTQIPDADLDVEYQANSDFAAESKILAEALLQANKDFSSDYPAELGTEMAFTDSWRFENMTASISVRENQRISEIGAGANPHWHQPSDVPETYSEADYRLGFNALQMTLGAVARLAGISRSVDPAQPQTAQR